MERYFKNWTDAEREAYFGALEIEPSQQSLQNYLQLLNKVLFS